MKIEVRRRIATGLVVCIQASVITPRVAETASKALDAVSDMDAFVGNKVDEISSNSSAELEIKVKNQSSPEGEDPTGGDPTGGDPTGGDPTGGDPTGGDPTGGDPTGGDPTGGDPTGGDPTGGDPTGGDPTGGDPTGGDPTGGDPTGGDPTGGDPTGGDPTGGDPTGGDPTGGDPTGGDPTGGDPTGGDPTGGDPSGCDPSGGNPELIIDTQLPLETDEEGESLTFDVSMTSIPPSPLRFKIVSTDPGEAQPFPASMEFWQNACTPQTVTVVGQNDGVVDGDADYEIELIDDSGRTIISLPGINYDNDQRPEIAVNIVGPPSLMRHEAGIYTIRVVNMEASTLSADAVAGLITHSLLIESTPGLNITGYACSYLSGEPCNEPTTLEHNLLQIDALDLAGGETLLISVDVFLADDYVEPARLTARFIETVTGEQTDDTEATVIAIFRSSFE